MNTVNQIHSSLSNNTEVKHMSPTLSYIQSQLKSSNSDAMIDFLNAKLTLNLLHGFQDAYEFVKVWMNDKPTYNLFNLIFDGIRAQFDDDMITDSSIMKQYEEFFQNYEEFEDLIDVYYYLCNGSTYSFVKFFIEMTEYWFYSCEGLYLFDYFEDDEDFFINWSKIDFQKEFEDFLSNNTEV